MNTLKSFVKYKERHEKTLVLFDSFTRLLFCELIVKETDDVPDLEYIKNNSLRLKALCDILPSFFAKHITDGAEKSLTIQLRDILSDFRIPHDLDLVMDMIDNECSDYALKVFSTNELVTDQIVARLKEVYNLGRKDLQRSWDLDGRMTGGVQEGTMTDGFSWIVQEPTMVSLYHGLEDPDVYLESLMMGTSLSPKMDSNGKEIPPDPAREAWMEVQEDRQMEKEVQRNSSTHFLRKSETSYVENLIRSKDSLNKTKRLARLKDKNSEGHGAFHQFATRDLERARELNEGLSLLGRMRALTKVTSVTTDGSLLTKGSCLGAMIEILTDFMMATLCHRLRFISSLKSKEFICVCIPELLPQDFCSSFTASGNPSDFYKKVKEFRENSLDPTVLCISSELYNSIYNDLISVSKQFKEIFEAHFILSFEVPSVFRDKVLNASDKSKQYDENVALREKLLLAELQGSNLMRIYSGDHYFEPEEVADMILHSEKTIIANPTENYKRAWEQVEQHMRTHDMVVVGTGPSDLKMDAVEVLMANNRINANS